MSSGTEKNATPSSLSPAVPVDLPAGEFCPILGQFSDASNKYHEELRCLLGRRLRIAAAIITASFVVLFLRNLLDSELRQMLKTELKVTHAVVTVSIGLLFGLLVYRPCLSVKQLRGVELLLFGIPSAFFIWMQYCFVCHCEGETLQKIAQIFPYRAVLPWLALIYIYGIFIPNRWQRAACIIGLMAILPFVGAAMSGSQQPEVQQALVDGGYESMLIWMGIGSVTAVYGSHRFGSLRREVFEAQHVGVYTLKEKLGSGGMGDVYLAEHHLLKRPCAIKLIKPEKADDPSALARFESEVQATASLTHQNTIEIYDYGHTEDGTFYYVMEYLPGMNLQEMVDRFGPLPPERVVYLVRQVCSALQEAHAVGLIHRDIKPGNIFSSERGGVHDVAKLLDFGLVKTIQHDSESIKNTMDGTVVGSPLFTAPEMALGETPDARTDIYSLGATAYFLLSGQPVFAGENPIRVIFAHANDEPEDIGSLDPGISAELAAVVMRCLAKKPVDRFENVRELEQALGRCEFDSDWTADRAVDWWESRSEDVAAGALVNVNTETVTMVADVQE